MSKKLSLLVVFALFIIGAVPAVHGQDAKKLTIAFVPGVVDPFYQTMEVGIRQAAADFCMKFDGIKVTSTGTKGGAYAAHHNKESGWGFTADFPLDKDGKLHLHAWIEFVGTAEDAARVAEQIKKIIGG